MAKDYKLIAKDILENIGGKENVSTAMNCYTRLRINLKDTGLVDLDAIKSLDVIGVQFQGQQLQIVIGNDVREAYKAFADEANLDIVQTINENLDRNLSTEKKKITVSSIFSAIIDGILNSIVPILPILIASGILKAFNLLVVQFGWMSPDSSTLFVLGFVADAAFYYLPVFIGFFAAKKFGATPALGAILGAALIHPSFVDAVNNGVGMNIFGISVYATGYSSTVIPIIFSVWIMSYIEKFFEKYSPKSIRTLLQPTLTILVMVPLMFGLLAPAGAILSEYFAIGLNWFYNTFGALAVAVWAAIIPWIVMFGLHYGTVPISLNSIALHGIDRIALPGFFISNFMQGAACLAVGIKAKDSDTKSLAYSSAFSNFIPGISEPGMYGITLRYKTPIIGAMIGGFFSGLYFGLTKIGVFSFLPPNVFAFAAFVGSGEYANNFLHSVIGIVLGIVITFVATTLLYKPEATQKNN